MQYSTRVTPERLALATPFIISRNVFTHAQLLVVEVHDGEFSGRGECEPHESDPEAPERVRSEIENALAMLAGTSLDRAGLASLLPAGPARNAVDCALWDLEAKRARRSVSSLIGAASPQPLETAYTLSIDTPEAMAVAAQNSPEWKTLKIKLGGSNCDNDLDRLRAIRRVRPDVRLIVDANGGWGFDLLTALAEPLAALGVSLIEQPLPPGEDAALAGYRCPVPFCADEACLDRGSLPAITGKYQFINIKLDKSGGLTEALALADAAKAANLGLMVGCNVGTSLAMAPAFILAQRATFVDLDGPLLLGSDRAHGLRYTDGMVYPPDPALWG